MMPAQARQVAYAMLRMAEELDPTVNRNQDGGTMLFNTAPDQNSVMKMR